MCLLLIANKVHPKFKLIIAANRDEFYDRPTSQAKYWADHPDLLAGRDLKQGGTWLGITKEGKIAAVTNYRDFSKIKPNAPTRGMLTTGFLTGIDSPQDYHKKIKLKAREYNGFNLIFGIKSELFFYSNYSSEFVRIGKGIFGLSNCLLDTPWPKVEKSKREMKKLIEESEFQFEKLFKILSDTSIAADETLPDTGVGLQLERILSSIFIKSSQYGTRCSTVITIDDNENVEFIENTYLNNENRFSKVNYKFKIKAK